MRIRGHKMDATVMAMFGAAENIPEPAGYDKSPAQELDQLWAGGLWDNIYNSYCICYCFRLIKSIRP